VKKIRKSVVHLTSRNEFAVVHAKVTAVLCPYLPINNSRTVRDSMFVVHAAAGRPKCTSSAALHCRTGNGVKMQHTRNIHAHSEKDFPVYCELLVSKPLSIGSFDVQTICDYNAFVTQSQRNS
jgi:hypothetical protein